MSNRFWEYHNSMKHFFLKFCFLLTAFFIFSGCTEQFLIKKMNPVEKAEYQKKRADMVISYDADGRIFVEQPLLNVIGGIHHPYTQDDFSIMLKERDHLSKSIVIVLDHTWNSHDNNQTRVMKIDRLQALLSPYFSHIIIHQKQEYSYTKILKE